MMAKGQDGALYSNKAKDEQFLPEIVLASYEERMLLYKSAYTPSNGHHWRYPFESAGARRAQRGEKG